MSAADARHQVANLLHSYVEIADVMDVEAAVQLLGTAKVTYPADGYSRPEASRGFFERLWATATPHRHDVSNLIVEPVEGQNRLWAARANYTRWVINPDPVLHTLGRYELTVAEDGWTIVALSVDRVWTKG